MDFPIIPYDTMPFDGSAVATAMNPWPSLLKKAFYLDCGNGEKIFYYDSPPQVNAPDNSASRNSPKVSGLSSSAGSMGSAVKEPAAPPVFILIHGLGDEADSWRHLIPLLNERGFRVLAVDLPGFGRSIAKEKINLKTHAKAVLKLLEAIDPKARVFLAGSSMGSIVAESVAFQKPELVSGLVLINGSIPGGPLNPGPLIVAKLLLSRKWYKAYRGKPEKAWRSLLPYYADLNNMPAEDRNFLQERVMARVESDTQEKSFFATQRSIIWTYLFSPSAYARKVRTYKGKILLVWGKKDKILPLSSAENFKALRSDIRLEFISDAGQLPHQERPAETGKLMAEFALSVIQNIFP